MWKLIVFWVTDLLVIKSVIPLKNVELCIKPIIVQRHHKATLRCSYDLQESHLYSVKWYRGTYEFYRYIPSEHPKTKIFPTADITVDLHNSNSTQVTLLNIDFPLSGKFTCEVTTDEPLYIGTDSKAMLVVQLPSDPPKISVRRKALDVGDVLRANCSSPPSRPKARLTFFLNGYQVAESPPLPPNQVKELAWSDLILELELNEFHFIGGRLMLKCVAEIEDVYCEEAELKLESAKEPVPERVWALGSGASIVAGRVLSIAIFLVLFFGKT